MKIGSLLLSIFIFLSFTSNADTLDAPEITLNGFIDAYYAGDYAEFNNYFTGFTVNHNRRNEFNINLATVGLDIEHKKYRAAINIQAGSYPSANYVAEPIMWCSIYQAWAGVKLGAKTWLDAGIFPSHLGFESPISAENPTLTRSMSAEASPYFLAGTRLHHQANENWSFGLTLCNGWQRITTRPGETLPSAGTQITYEKNKFQLNWSTYIGSEVPDSLNNIRFFNNLFAKFDLGTKNHVILGFDIGVLSNPMARPSTFTWYNATAILQHEFSNKWACAGRAEYFRDDQNIVTPFPWNVNFHTAALSFNVDYKPVSPISCRAEVKVANSLNPNITVQSSMGNYALFTASLAYLFDRKL
ncbi:porin [bacterium]|nr:porin [bacterium]